MGSTPAVFDNNSEMLRVAIQVECMQTKPHPAMARPRPRPQCNSKLSEQLVHLLLWLLPTGKLLPGKGAHADRKPTKRTQDKPSALFSMSGIQPYIKPYSLSS